MAYLLAKNNNTPPASQKLLAQVIAGASGMASVTSYLHFFLSGSNFRIFFDRLNTGGTTPTAQTAEQSNSRSGAPGSTTNVGYVTDPTLIGGHVIAIARAATGAFQCSPICFRPPPRYPILLEPAATAGITESGTVAGNPNLVFDEGGRRFEAPMGRRGRRPGWGFYADYAQIMPGLITAPFTANPISPPAFVQPADWSPTVVANPMLLLALAGPVEIEPPVRIVLQAVNRSSTT
jgi:hypothetical protein